jgi:DNA gyrase subunit A
MQNPNENIRDLLIEDEMKDSYMSYAMSVIMSRALPDVRDGLKPSQRRILVAMDDLNLGPRSARTKCASIVGETMKKYHPHGDQAIYPTLVRMAQDFSIRYMLVDGKGNFGSVDGDSPAAMRYTEARVTDATVEMLGDIQMETVDFQPNYDESTTEPSVLPSRFPNLLCNGATGIAVGMATSIPPHNLTEICDALVHVIDNPECELRELLQIVTGPDFPTGGLICGRRGILNGYTTGRGSVVVRARVKREEQRKGKTNLVVTEIPYQSNKQRIAEQIGHLVREGRLPGVSDVRDESDREGMRLVVEVKRGEDPEIVLNQLFQYTQLQDTFSIIMLAIVGNRPRTLNLKEMIEAFIDHRIHVIRRRTSYLLRQAKERAHILEGMRIALAHIDEIIELIKQSKDADMARAGLMDRYELSERQANAILHLQLQRLTSLEQLKIEQEYEALQEKIREYETILADRNLVLDIMREDMYELKRKYGDERRTSIVDEADEIEIEDLIAEEDMAVTITHEGYIKRLPLSNYRRQGRGGKGVIGASAKEGDFLEHLFIASTHDYILFFTSNGRVHWRKVYQFPQLSRTSRGRAIVNMLQLAKGEKVSRMIPVRAFDDQRQLVMCTRKGVVKKTALSAYSRPLKAGIIGINMDKGDELVSVVLAHGDDELVIGTRAGQAIRFHERELRSQGRNTRGVRGIKLRGKDYVVGMEVVQEGASLLTVCEKGYGKRTEFGSYRTQSRGGLGLIDIKTTGRNGQVTGLMFVGEDDDIMLITKEGKVVRTGVKSISQIGRNTQGVRVIGLSSTDRVVSIAKVVGNGKGDDQPEPSPGVESVESVEGAEGADEAQGSETES